MLAQLKRKRKKDPLEQFAKRNKRRVRKYCNYTITKMNILLLKMKDVRPGKWLRRQSAELACRRVWVPSPALPVPDWFSALSLARSLSYKVRLFHKMKDSQFSTHYLKLRLVNTGLLQLTPKEMKIQTTSHGLFTYWQKIYNSDIPTLWNCWQNTHTRLLLSAGLLGASTLQTSTAITRTDTPTSKCPCNFVTDVIYYVVTGRGKEKEPDTCRWGDPTLLYRAWSLI